MKHNKSIIDGVLTLMLIVGTTLVMSMIIYAFAHTRPIQENSSEVIAETSGVVTTDFVTTDFVTEVTTEIETTADTQTEEVTIETETEAVITETETEEDIIWDSVPDVPYEAAELQLVPPDTEATQEADNYEFYYDCIDAIYIAKTVNIEAPHCSTMEQAAVMWCILNRVDNPEFPNTVYEVVTASNQFGYYESTPLRDDLYCLALDVLNRWRCEKAGTFTGIGRVLPSEYMYFWGDGKHNHFRINETDRWYWDWSWYNPYESEIWDIPLYEV